MRARSRAICSACSTTFTGSKSSTATVGGGETLLTLIDFGIFKELSTTGERHFVGTPRYSAPEQRGVRGNIGPRTDLFAVGVVLYELLSGGKHPYGGVPERIWDDRTPAVPLSEAAPGTPQEICDAIMAAVERDAAKRPESARALAKPFRRFHREATRLQGSSNASSSTGGDLLKNLIASGDDIHALRTDAPHGAEPDPFKAPTPSARTAITAIGLAPTTPAPGDAVAAARPSGSGGTAPLPAVDEVDAAPRASGLDALADSARKEPEVASVDGTSATNQRPATRLRTPLALSLVAAASLVVTATTWGVLRARAPHVPAKVETAAATDNVAATSPAAIPAPLPEARAEAPAPASSPSAVPSAAPPTASTPLAAPRAEHLRVKPIASASTSSSTSDVFAPPAPATDASARVGFEKDGVKFFLDTDPHPGTPSKHAPRAPASAPQGAP